MESTSTNQLRMKIEVPDLTLSVQLNDGQSVHGSPKLQGLIFQRKSLLIEHC